MLKKSRVLTFADFTNKPESDVEDMFDEGFYVELVNQEFSPSPPLTAASLPGNSPRLAVRVEEYFGANPLPDGVRYNHYRPARCFAENPARAGGVPEATLERFERAFIALNRLL